MSKRNLKNAFLTIIPYYFRINGIVVKLPKIAVSKMTWISCLLFYFIISVIWPCLSIAITAKDKYIQAEASYHKLLKSPKRLKYRDNWLTCIEQFQDVYRHNPSGPWAAAGMYMSGRLYQELYKHSFKASDIKEAFDIFERIVKRYPQSSYKNKAIQALRSISEKKRGPYVSGNSENRKQKKEKFKKPVPSASPSKAPVKKKINTVTKTPIMVNGLRFWSNPNYTRIVIDADGETSFTHRLLKRDPSINKPQRLYVDLKNSKLAKNTEKIVPINDNLLRDARAGQYTLDSVRVVADIKSFDRYKIFSLKNPFRIVIDVWEHDVAAKSTQTHLKPISKSYHDIAEGALAKQLALGVSRIVIDPGHGGHDFGAPGYLKGIHEKDIVLQISKRLAKMIRKNLGCEVILTRDSDRYLTLEERTAIANTKNADLFISIHTNAARDRKAFGIETFFLNLATDNEAILVAARENATSTKNISDLQTILNDLMQNAKISESSRLSGYIQTSLCRNMQKEYTMIKNKGVKQAPFYVLLGAQMPAILVECSFISNPRECRRLINSKYQDHLCECIVKGIRNYIIETNPTAFMQTDLQAGKKS
ncbi:MAG: N-acetylmuramoyl-L-alanine amidase [Desulfobacterales bacterium]|nr:N-acetylmuramoyl-L-alanine amidase [Desulfobacterales bacterium]